MTTQPFIETQEFEVTWMVTGRNLIRPAEGYRQQQQMQKETYLPEHGPWSVLVAVSVDVRDVPVNVLRNVYGDTDVSQIRLPMLCVYWERKVRWFKQEQTQPAEEETP